MAKKTTKKTTTKAAGKKPSATGGAKKKTTRKPATKKAAAKSAGKSAAKPQTATGEKATTKKAASAPSEPRKKKPSGKAAPAEAAASASVEAAAEPLVNPRNNGKQGHAQADVQPSPPPAPIRRVIRPTPPAPVEQDADDWTPLSDAKLRKVKTGLTRKDLEYFKQLLLEKRAEIVGDVMGMEEARASGNGGDLSNMPLHMADIGSDNYEQEFTLGLVESERKLLVEIDRALQRIQDKTYGVCLITGTPIPKARLEIKPWAKYSIEIVRQREKRGLHSF